MYASRRRSHSSPERRCGLGAPLRGHLSVRARAPHVRRGNGQTIVHLRVCQHILRGRALLGIDGQQLPDEVLGRRRDVVPPRRREVIPARGEGRSENETDRKAVEECSTDGHLQNGAGPSDQGSAAAKSNRCQVESPTSFCGASDDGSPRKLGSERVACNPLLLLVARTCP